MWTFLLPGATIESLGMLPGIVFAEDPRPVREQIDDRYGHGGGWSPFRGFTVAPDRLSITYPDDPPMRAIAKTQIRDEEVIFYEAEWLGVFQPDGTYEITRMD